MFPRSGYVQQRIKLHLNFRDQSGSAGKGKSSDSFNVLLYTVLRLAMDECYSEINNDLNKIFKHDTTRYRYISFSRPTTLTT